jgi:hypothetical protein
MFIYILLLKQIDLAKKIDTLKFVIPNNYPFIVNDLYKKNNCKVNFFRYSIKLKLLKQQNVIILLKT